MRHFSLPTVVLASLALLFAGCGGESGGRRSSPADIDDAVQKLKTGTQEEKIKAAEKLGAMGETAAAAVPELIEAMKQGNSMFDPVEMAASKALAQIGKPAAEALVVEVRKGASRMSISSTLGDLAHHVVPELTEMSRDPDERVRKRGIEALAEAGPEAAPVIGEALRDVEESVQRAAATALRKMGSDAAGAVPELIAAVERRDSAVIGDVVVILGQVGPEAKNALPALESLQRGEKMPEGKQLSGGLKQEIEKSIRKIRGDIRTP